MPDDRNPSDLIVDIGCLAFWILGMAAVLVFVAILIGVLT